MTSIVSSAWNTVVRRAVGNNRGQNKDALGETSVTGAIDEYCDLFEETNEERGRSKTKTTERKAKYATMVNHYYDLVTDFYEYGWGQSFHFAPRFRGEEFHASIARHEYSLALKLGLKPGMRVMDAGCGVGGPMRNIARFSGATIVGVNNNAYQVARSNKLNADAGLSTLCSTVKGDFMNLPFEPNTFDAIYGIEATCHAPDKAACFAQMFRALKDGGVFAVYDWVMTDKYDETNEEHRYVKWGIEKGDSLPDLPPAAAVAQAMEKAGFEVLEHYDVSTEAEKSGNDVGWWTTLQGGCSLSQMKHTRCGRRLTQTMVDVLETVRIAPRGTSKTHQMLCLGADTLARGGELGIFTPMYFAIGRKPVRKGGNNNNNKSQ